MTYEDQTGWQDQDNHSGIDPSAGKRKVRAASNSRYQLVSVIPDQSDMDRAKALLTENLQLATKKSEIESRLEEIRLELASICLAHNLPGFRYGLIVFECHGYKTKSNLNKGLLSSRLAQYGVPASVIGECYVEGESYLSCRSTVFDMP